MKYTFGNSLKTFEFCLHQRTFLALSYIMHNKRAIRKDSFGLILFTGIITVLCLFHSFGISWPVRTHAKFNSCPAYSACDINRIILNAQSSVSFTVDLFFLFARLRIKWKVWNGIFAVLLSTISLALIAFLYLLDKPLPREYYAFVGERAQLSLESVFVVAIIREVMVVSHAVLYLWLFPLGWRLPDRYEPSLNQAILPTPAASDDYELVDLPQGPDCHGRQSLATEFRLQRRNSPLGRTVGDNHATPSQT